MHNDFLKAVLLANRKIYLTLKNSFKDIWFNEHSIGAGGDISSGFDLFAEEIFVKSLKKFGKIDSEECGVIGSGEYSIVIDPIDGSSNALSSFPYYGSSVALKDKNNQIIVAVVCNFANGDLFYKINNDKLMFGNVLSDNFEPEQSVQKPKIGLFEKAYEYSNIIKKLTLNGLKFRAPGATALSLAYAHRVKFVIFVGEIREYDIAAGLAFCNDLKVALSKNYVIVTQEKEILDKIEQIILEEKNELR